jgi:hypothetical protein
MSDQCNVLQQLRRSRIPIALPIRYDNLILSPYPAHTKYELDMRRKAEILEYKPNNKNTLQNNFTKSQKFSQLVNRKTKPQTCPDTIIYKPTYYSGVPGPVQNLFLNPLVPLYNYQVVREYTDLYFTDNTQWKYTSYSNIKCDTNSSPLLGSLYIKDNIDDNSYTFSLKIPINIYVSGLNNINYDVDFIRKNSDIQILSVSLNVFYNGKSLNNPGVLKKVTPTYDLTNTYNLNINTKDSGTNTFSANIFTGYVIINNINLYTVKGYIYDFYININTNIQLNDDNYLQPDYYKNIEYYAIVNSTNPNQLSNCIVNTGNTDSTKTITITGTNTKYKTYTSNISLI